MEMNTVTVVCSVDDREETACSYSTKLIHGLECFPGSPKRTLLYNALPLFAVAFCPLKLIRCTKTKNIEETMSF